MNQRDLPLTGTYVMCKFEDQTADLIHEWAMENHIPEPIPANKLHVTVMKSVSREIPGYETINDEQLNIKAQPIGINLLQSEMTGAHALIVRLLSLELLELYQDVKLRGGVDILERYVPHVSISYQLPEDFPINEIELPTFDIIVNRVIAEPIDDDWFQR